MKSERIEMNIKGKPVAASAARIEGKEIVTGGKWIRIASLKEEWDEEVGNPEYVIQEIKKSGLNADLFTFVQRLPEEKPIYEYRRELEPVAAIPIANFEQWWKELPKKTRQNVRNTERFGIVTGKVEFTDDLVRDIMSIYNESPVRQGKPFWHYGKDFETVKRENSTFLERCDFIGAYHDTELVGFIRLVYSGNIAYPFQIISKTGYWEKTRPANALVTKAVELCEKRGIKFLTYGKWSDGSLSEFKRRNGFQKFLLPRYYVPLSAAGGLVLKMNLHHGVVGIIPEKLIPHLKKVRKTWYSIKYRGKMSDREL